MSSPTAERRRGNQIFSDEVPPSPYFVIATDSRMSFTPASSGKRAILVFLAKDAAQAKIIEENVMAREDLRDAKIVRSFKGDPTLLVSLMTEEKNGMWYRPGTFRMVEDATFQNFANWATAETIKIASADSDTLKLFPALLTHDSSGRTVKAAIERLMKRKPDTKKLLVSSQSTESERIDWGEVVDYFRNILELERRAMRNERRTADRGDRRSRRV
jgi:hypothetical protein